MITLFFPNQIIGNHNNGLDNYLSVEAQLKPFHPISEHDI